MQLHKSAIQQCFIVSFLLDGAFMCAYVWRQCMCQHERLTPASILSQRSCMRPCMCSWLTLCNCSTKCDKFLKICKVKLNISVSICFQFKNTGKRTHTHTQIYAEKNVHTCQCYRIINQSKSELQKGIPRHQTHWAYSIFPLLHL